MIKIKRKVYDSIVEKMCESPHEVGGILAMRDLIICDFCFDKGKGDSPFFYEPNTMLLNAVIEAWEKAGLVFVGVIHSHLYGSGELSPKDMEYVSLVRESMPDISTLLFPVFIMSDNKPKIRFFECSNGCEEISVEIIE